MNKRRITILCLCLVLTAVLLAVQHHLLQRFGADLPRLEICFEGTIPPEAVEALRTYDAYAEENRLVIEGEGLSLLLAQEVSDVLTGSGMDDFVLNDRTQAGVLAVQSWTLWLLVAGIFLMMLLAECFYLDCRDLREDWTDARQHMYFGKWLKESIEKLLILLIRWAVMVFVAILATRWLIDSRIYIPAEVLPPETVFDISHYLHITLPPVSGSTYEAMCRTVLPMLYGLTVAAGLTTALAAWMIHKLLRRHYAKKIYRRDYHG